MLCGQKQEDCDRWIGKRITQVATFTAATPVTVGTVLADCAIDLMDHGGHTGQQ